MSYPAEVTSKRPLLSIVIPVRNGAQWLGETLDSIYGQTESNFEILLIDDASTDDLRDVLAHHQDDRLHVVRLTSNVGVSSARNRGVELAQGNFIAFCDADDLCHSRRFELQLNFLHDNPNVGLCGSAFTCFDAQDRETVSPPLSDEAIRKALMKANCFGLSTVMAKASVLKSMPFNSNLSVAEDYDLWTRLVSNGVQVANLPESLVRYRVHSQQVSRHKGEVLDQTSRRIRARYCLSILGKHAMADELDEKVLAQHDLERCAISVAEFASLQSDFAPMDFRFLLAWQYQVQPHHNLRAWFHWVKIQRKLGLNLDRNYRINTALLALLSWCIRGRYFDVLIKLKR